MKPQESAFSKAFQYLFPQHPAPQPLQQGQTVSSFPGWQEANARGGFKMPQDSNIDLGSISNALKLLFHGNQPNPQPQPHMTTEQAAQQFVNQNPGWHIATPSAAPTAIPTPTPQTMTPENFKFQMGLKDYSHMLPQLQNMLKGSPLEQFIPQFMQAANQYGVDPRILPLIANNESSMGRNYPTDSFNAFGYTPQNPALPNGGTPNDRLHYAGFTSIPMAIDRLTNRFVRPGTPQGYANFRQDPTIANLQQAYNANPAEQGTWLTNAQALLPMMQ